MERTQDFDVPAEELWEAVTDPEQMGWLGDEVSLDVRPGGTGRITDDGETREVRVDTVDAGRHLSFRWWPEGDEDMASRVDLIVVPRPPGSRLVVRETLPVPVAAIGAGGQAEARALATSGGEPTGWDHRLVILGLATLPPLALAAAGGRC
ncbi:MAG: SRPBCC domain-containing protein [Acidimicrobiales bacterium]